MRQIGISELKDGEFYLGYHKPVGGTYRHYALFKYNRDEDTVNYYYYMIGKYDCEHDILVRDLGEDGFGNIGSNHYDYINHGAIFELTNAEVMVHLHMEDI
jgi:hypothetical protein